MARTQAQPQSRARRLTLVALALALCAGGAFAFATLHRPPPLVEVETMAPGPVSLVLALNGQVRPRAEVPLRALVPATVEAVAVREGARIEAGDLLIRLDQSLVAARRDQARAALEVQKAREAQARSAARRAEGLGSAVISRADAETAALALQTAEGESLRLQAALDEVERDMARYELRAPISGVVLLRQVEAGQQVSAQDQLMLLADPSDLLIEAEVDELYAGRIREGQKVRLRAMGETDIHDGTITYAAPRLDPDSGGRRIEIALARSADLPIGLTVEVNVTVATETAALSVPRAALSRQGTDWRVLVAEGGKARARIVSIIDWPSERVVVTGGLQSGEQVILGPDGLTPERDIRLP